MRKMEKRNLIQAKSFDFSLKIIELYKKLQADKEYIISKQLLRAGTSIGANIEEALAGQSKKDFSHKMAIATKEARESRYWLRLLQQATITSVNVNTELHQVEEIVAILTAIVKTMRSKQT